MIKTLAHGIHELLANWKPDLVIEVLPEFEAALNDVSILTELGYKAHSITPDGLQPTGRTTPHVRGILS